MTGRQATRYIYNEKSSSAISHNVGVALTAIEAEFRDSPPLTSYDLREFRSSIRILRFKHWTQDIVPITTSCGSTSNFESVDEHFRHQDREESAM